MSQDETTESLSPGLRENVDRRERDQSLQPEVSQRCMDVVQEFHTGSITKIKVILKIQDAIP
jgi:predicted translin family RNA/ssDNA-binding protein